MSEGRNTELVSELRECERLRRERDHWKYGHDASERQRDEALAALKASEEARDATTKLADRYGVALMMIRAGCSNPQRFAGNILDDVKPIDIDLEDLT